MNHLRCPLLLHPPRLSPGRADRRGLAQPDDGDGVGTGLLVRPRQGVLRRARGGGVRQRVVQRQGALRLVRPGQGGRHGVGWVATLKIPPF